MSTRRHPSDLVYIEGASIPDGLYRLVEVDREVRCLEEERVCQDRRCREWRTVERVETGELFHGVSECRMSGRRPAAWKEVLLSERERSLRRPLPVEVLAAGEAEGEPVITGSGRAVRTKRSK